MIRSLPVRLLSTTLCLAVVLAGCTTQDAAPDRPTIEARTASEAPAPAPRYAYTVDHADDGVVYTAWNGPVAVATLAVDVDGKVLVFDQGDSHMTMRFHEDARGRLVADGDANGHRFAISMVPDQLETLVVEGGSPPVTAVFREASAAFGEVGAVGAISRSCWWECLECAAVLVGAGLGLWALWPVIVPLAALIAEVGWTAFGALTATEIAGLLGVGATLAEAIVGPCRDCVKCLVD